MEGAHGVLLNCHMYQLFIEVNLSLKKHPNLERSLFTNQTLVFEEFLINISNGTKYQISTALITNFFFSKIDKDLKTGF